MRQLTPLERMFVEEFCRFADVGIHGVDQLRVLDRSRNPVGFMTSVNQRTVPAYLRWGARVFDSPKVAIVGPSHTECGFLLFFGKESGALEAIEGFVYGEAWPEFEEPCYWSETSRVVGSGARQ